MLAINMSDVVNVLNSCASQLKFFGVVLALAIVVIIAVLKLPKALKRLIRGEAGIAIVLALVITVNLICNGPMSTMLDLVTGSGSIDEATSAKATDLVTQICEEGIVLAENEGILPLASKKLNVFGWASTNPCYGGTGSGALNTAYPTTTLLQGLANAGIEVNGELTKFYTDYKSDRPVVGMWAQDWTLPEPNVSLYTDAMMDNAKAYSDTALIVITRVGGEGADLPSDMCAVVDGSWKDQVDTYYDGVYDDALNAGNDWNEGDHFLQLSNREKEMIDLVCSNFDNVVVLYNGANSFEMGWVNDYKQIKGVLLCPGTGQSGFAALGKVLTGEVNPSGRTVDTYVADLKATPVWNNSGNFQYDNMQEFTVSSRSFLDGSVTDVMPTFVNYVEGIYVGYKFYETAAVEGLIDYDKTVVYPFGYGLSYTTFTQKIGNVKTDAKTISFDVTVTNTGSTAGKDVVEVYYNPPYTNGGIEKSTANLIDFAKTEILQPGASETVTFTFAAEDMASYDEKNAGAYVLEAGSYIISVNSSSHTVLDSFEYNVASDVVYGENNKRDSDVTAAVNQFDYAAGEVTYLSRADGFANYEVATAAPATYSMTAEQKASFYNISNYLTEEATVADEDSTAHAVTTGANNGIQLVSLRGLSYDDPKWDEYLDEMTLDDMNAIISLGGYQTNSYNSATAGVKLRTNDCDGPASINNNFTGVGSVGFPAAVMIANTWNKEMARAFGDSIGEMADQMDTSGWYGPAMNNHRSAFAGRNFEYYSEDGVLSGYMASNAVAGAQAHGVYAYMKHFALNDQEANRCAMLCTWSNEQAIREIYLKPFEMSVKLSDCHAVMSSFNYIGNRWAGGSASLCKNVLRGEWGFVGLVETDYFGVYGYMSSDQAIRNGTDLMLVNYPTATNNVQFRDTNGAQAAMRTSAHNILYTVVNSRAYADENLNPPTPIWHTMLLAGTIIVAILLALWELLLVKNFIKRKKGQKV